MAANSNTVEPTSTKNPQLVQQTLEFYERKRTKSLGARESTNTSEKCTTNILPEQNILNNTQHLEWQNDNVPENKKKRTRDSPNGTNSREGKRSALDTRFVISTSNMFAPLSGKVTTNQESDNEQPIIVKPEPIFVTGINTIQHLTKTLESIIAKEKYMLTTMKTGHMVKIMPNDVETYKIIRDHFLEKNISHYTYQLKHEKSYRVILRGIHHSESIQVIKEAIEDLGHLVRNITNARHRVTKGPLPLFYIDLEPNSNNKKIFDVKHLNRSIVTFEAPYTKKEVVQCKRCQRFGHTKNFCHRPHRCVKCGETHPTASCQKVRETPAICINCNGNHPANYRGCKTYQEYKQQIFEPNKRTRIPINPNIIKSQNNAEQPSRNSGMSYAQVAKGNTQWNEAPKEDVTTNQPDILSGMNQMLTKFQKTMESLMDKMLDRMFDLVMTIVNRK